MTDLSQLIERIEAASGPDRELDMLIQNACRKGRKRHHTDSYRAANAPRYTASIDAAMTLVPTGWLMAGLWERNTNRPNWRWKAELWSPDADRDVSGIARNSESPALAICAAALRARIKEME